MQKVNVFIHIWNDLRSNDRFGFNTKIAPCELRIGYIILRDKISPWIILSKGYKFSI